MEITSASGSGVPGSNMTLSGPGPFGASQDADARVLFWPSDDETPKVASVVSWSNNVIVVTVPATATPNVANAFFTVTRPTTIGPNGAKSPFFTTGVLNNYTDWTNRAVEAKNPSVAAPPPYANVPVGTVTSDAGASVNVSWIPSGFSVGIAKAQLRAFGTLSYNYLKRILRANI